jgi:dienelactone hydrolase
MMRRGGFVRAVVAALVLGAGRLAAQQTHAADSAAVLALPAPTGPYAVGTADWFVADSSRVDTLDGYTGPRRLRVTVWYPAPPATRGEGAPYLRSGPAEFGVLAGLTRRPAESFAHLAGARSHGIVGAPVAEDAGALPAILLSHGYLSTPSVHTAVAEELASHGYAVFAVAHTGEAQAVTFADGPAATMVDAAGTGLNARAAAVIGEWGPEDGTMTAVTAAATDDERRALLRGYLAAIPATTLSLARWATDLRVVLDDALSGASPLGERLDAARIGALGHSFGGVTAAEFCRVDARCAAALNLDGIPQYGSMLDAGAARPFLMLYTERDGRVGASDVIYRNTRAPYWRAVLARSRHLDPSDWALFGPVLRRGGGFGTVEGDEAVRLTNRLVREWFDQELRGRPSPLLSGTQPEPGLTVERVSPDIR